MVNLKVREGHPANTGTNSYSYDYDRYGNRWHQSLNGAQTGYAFNANNQISSGYGVTYDSIGNVISFNDGTSTHTYKYDAEGRLISVDNGAAASYLYDAEGHRAGTTVGSTTNEFVFDLSNHLAGMMQTTGTRSWNREEIYAGGWHLASYGTAGLQFNHADWLGTVRVRTNTSGAVINSYANLPFGDCVGGGTNCSAYFTDQDRDSETGLDHFMYRQYSAIQGRWMRPDPVGMGAADTGNPQSWNQYAYVANNPISAIDLFGLEMCDGGSQGACDSGGGGGGIDWSVCGICMMANPNEAVMDGSLVAVEVANVALQSGLAFYGPQRFGFMHNSNGDAVAYQFNYSPNGKGGYSTSGNVGNDHCWTSTFDGVGGIWCGSEDNHYPLGEAGTVYGKRPKSNLIDSNCFVDSDSNINLSATYSSPSGCGGTPTVDTEVVLKGGPGFGCSENKKCWTMTWGIHSATYCPQQFRQITPVSDQTIIRGLTYCSFSNETEIWWGAGGGHDIILNPGAPPMPPVLRKRP